MQNEITFDVLDKPDGSVKVYVSVTPDVSTLYEWSVPWAEFDKNMKRTSLGMDS
jgi:hypothetical protein